ncbi:Manganese/iron superoxide dismutase [Boletus edulis]|nr:Manganese/iron superoxide dismutase [Boletus edulis]
MAHVLPDFPYPYNALQPYISEQIMRLHHTKHHQGYVNTLNAAEASYVKAVTPKECYALQAVLEFNGGGNINHSLFWTNLAPSATRERAHRSHRGSVNAFKKEFNTTPAAIQAAVEVVC